MDIICLGELLVDMFPAELGRPLAEVSAFRPKPGGAPANVAVAARRLGKTSAFIGKVGDDAFGHHLAGVLETEGVDVSGMRYDEQARTAMAFIAMPDENNYDILFYRNPGADMRLRADELDAGLLGQTKVFHFGSISLIQEPSRSATLKAVELARRAGALISFDVNYRPDLWSREAAYERVVDTLPLVDLVKINEIEADILGDGGDVASVGHALLEQGPRLCVVTLGPEGSYFYIAEGGDHMPAFKVDTVDATGCGDAFIAALLCQLVSPLPGPLPNREREKLSWRDHLTVERLRNVLRYASAAGALTSLTQGVIPALPTAAEVEAFLTGKGET
ncbi:MAG: carbohydrate kinase [Anaerolineae bacterium]|nr:carbohydrate kinase [Anaerolineae bacterium]